MAYPIAPVNGQVYGDKIYNSVKNAWLKNIENIIGKIVLFGGLVAPDGYLFCNGQAVSRIEYSLLFAAIGTTWGIGDGSTTFNVPDFRESAPTGAGIYSIVTGTTHGISKTADSFSVAEYKDDQIQNITGSIYVDSPTVSANGAFTGVQEGASGTNLEGDRTVRYSFDASKVVRTGTVTRGKRLGVNFIIKYR